MLGPPIQCTYPDAIRTYLSPVGVGVGVCAYMCVAGRGVICRRGCGLNYLHDIRASVTNPEIVLLCVNSLALLLLPSPSLVQQRQRTLLMFAGRTDSATRT